MANIRIEKEQLEVPGEVLDRTDQTITWIQRNAKYFLAAAIVGLGIFVARNAMDNRRTQTLMAANDILAEAVELYEGALDSTNFGTPERNEQLRPALDKLAEVRAQFPDTPVAHLALFLEGNVYYNLGDEIGGSAPNTARAIDVYTRYITEAKTDLDRAQGWLAIGYANENAFFLTNQQQYAAEALSAYRKVGELKDSGFLRYEAMLAEARLLANAGNEVEAAKKLYRRILDERLEQVPPPRDPDNPNQSLLFNIRTASTQFSLANTARIELARLGVDVDEEYPVVAEEPSRRAN